ncbi:MAG: hypothetical protein RLY78_3140 [Pseudomonadota bacterium]|jgi:PqqD family protein of HPr-rel-A system
MTAAAAAGSLDTAAPAWGLAPRVSLQWRQLDEVDWVVFEPGAGQMHALDPLAAAVLTLVEAGSGDEPQLLAELQSHWPGQDRVPDAAALQPLLDQTLQALAAAGLIAPGPGPVAAPLAAVVATGAVPAAGPDPSAVALPPGSP